MRPLTQLQEDGVSFDRIPCREDGSLCLEQAEGMIRPNTRAVVMLHASNVCGTMLPVAEMGELCRRKGLRFFVDFAQTAGIFPIDMTAWNIDALAFAGHKGLLGPQGIGGFLIRDDLVPEVRPLLSGGTGSQSNLETVPPFMPDRFEAGTQNLPGIFGLHAALDYLERTGIDAIRERELALTGRLLEGFRGISGLRLAGKDDLTARTAVVSVDFTGLDNAEAAFQLEDRFGILTRCGLHCAPNAHKTLGTYPQGTVRFSPGHLTGEGEIDAAIQAVEAICKNAR